MYIVVLIRYQPTGINIYLVHICIFCHVFMTLAISQGSKQIYPNTYPILRQCKKVGFTITKRNGMWDMSTFLSKEYKGEIHFSYKENSCACDIFSFYAILSIFRPKGKASFIISHILEKFSDEAPIESCRKLKFQVLVTLKFEDPFCMLLAKLNAGG